MANQPKKRTQNIHDEAGGDASLDAFDLHLWAICLSAQRIFDTEVIFISSRDMDDVKSDEVIEFFVPHDHPRIGDLEAYLLKTFQPFRRHLEAARGWRVDIRVRRYSVDLRLWAICLSAQRTFDAEVIFQRSPAIGEKKWDEVIQFCVPRDHPRIEDVEAYLVKALQPFQRNLEPSNSWRVDIRVRRYSGVAAARAFHSAADAIYAATHPANVSTDRIIEMAFQAGCQAARSTKYYH